MKEDIIKEYWINNALEVKQFIENKPKYQQLCMEIEEIIKNILDTNHIRYALITSRTKTLNSFIEKIERKNYKDPFNEIKDFAGLRIVALYKDEIPLIEKLIEKEFIVKEKIDRNNDIDADFFGYEAIHYILQIGPKNKGIRYSKLKTLVCELQVRTILQDAWAIVAHHMIYKREKDIPKTLQRKLNSLVGLFETADEQFCLIKNEREKYLSKIELNPITILDEEINLDSLIEYSKFKFPNSQYHEDILSKLLSMKGIEKYKTVGELDDIVKKYINAINEYKNKNQTEFHRNNSSSYINLAIACDNEIFYNNYVGGWTYIATQIINKYNVWK